MAEAMMAVILAFIGGGLLAGVWAQPGSTISRSFKYMGCFADGIEPRAMTGGALRLTESLTPSLCNEYCRDRGSEFFGLQYTSGCFCGNSFDTWGPSTECTLPCVGDSSVICGGSWANSVYRVVRQEGSGGGIQLSGDGGNPDADQLNVDFEGNWIGGDTADTAEAAAGGIYGGSEADEYGSIGGSSAFDGAQVAGAVNLDEAPFANNGGDVLNSQQWLLATTYQPGGAGGFDAATPPSPVPPVACSTTLQQCDGRYWKGAKCCTAGNYCKYGNVYYSQCKPDTNCAAKWGRCGGQLWTGNTCCKWGNTCYAVDKWWSHCAPNSPSTTPAPTPPTPVPKAPAPTPKPTSVTPVPAPTPVLKAPAPVTSSVVVTPPSSSVVISPIPAANTLVVTDSRMSGPIPQPLWNWGAVAGVTGIPVPTNATYSERGGMSACGGGGKAVLSFQCPHMMLASPDMKYAAAADGNDWAMYGVAGMGSVANCGECYQLATLDKARMWVVQAFNSGPDVASGNFDIFIAAGGLGLYNACSGDCKTTTGCGGQCTASFFDSPHGLWAPANNCYRGGVLTVAGCDAVTSGSTSYKDKLQKYGCRETRNTGWKNNFTIQSQRVKCPENLVRVTGLRLANESGLPTPSKSLLLTHNGYTSTMQDCCKPSCAWRHMNVDPAFPAVYSCDINGRPLNTPTIVT